MTEQMTVWRPQTDDCRWKDVPITQYKSDGTHFKDVTRQVLFDDPNLLCQLRYFEVAAGGYSTLERHEHMHAVMIIRGCGQALVDDELFAVGMHDLVTVPPMCWHQFRAAADEPLGFLCLVNVERDRPQLPGADDLAALRRLPMVADFIRV